MKSKKGVANIILVMIMVIIVFYLITLISGMVKKIIKNNLEISEIKVRLMREDIQIKDLKGDFTSPDIVNITLKKGPMKIISKNKVNVNLYADVISAVDLSNSMNILNAIDEAKDSTKSFIDSVLATEGNRIGLVGYKGTPIATSYCHDISTDVTSLKNKVDYWSASGSTCTCCAINKATEYLRNSENLKVMVVMSDGFPSDPCNEQGTGDARQDAIQAAAEAYNNYGIKVYTVGFGNLSDWVNMNAIATAGHGTFHYANLTKLEGAYLNISKEITEYVHEELFSYLKVVFYNATNSYQKQISDLPNPLETRTYYLNVSHEITNLQKIEIYAVSSTKSGEEVLRLLDIWKIK